MKNKNFILTSVLSLSMVIGLASLVKAQCPKCYSNPACTVESPCAIYVLNNTLSCTVTNLTGYTNDPCDGPLPCNTSDTTHSLPGWYGNLPGLLTNGHTVSLGISYITNDCGCFCVDGISWSGGWLDLNTHTVNGTNMIPVSTSCCPSGFAQINVSGPMDICPTGSTCPPYQSAEIYTITCHP